MKPFAIIMACLVSGTVLVSPAYPAEKNAFPEPESTLPPPEMEKATLPNPKSTLPPPQREKIYIPEVEASLYPFDEETYSLAYQTFVVKKDLKSAYIVAFAAVKQKPLSKEWRARLAQISLWTSKPHEALDQYQYLIFQLHDDAFLPSAIDLADKLNALDTLSNLWALRIKKGPLTNEEKYRYAQLHERSGDVNKAIDLYSTHYQKSKNPDDLLHIAELEYAQGNVANTKKLLQNLVQAKQLTETPVLKLAQILYQQGQYPEALRVLKLILLNSTPKSEIYWITVGEIAWTLEDNPTAKIALEHLVQNPKVTPDNLYRIAILLQKPEPKRALQFAKLAWGKNKNFTLFMFIVDLQAQMSDWNAFQQFLRQAPESILTQANSQPYFWEIKSQSYIASEQIAEAFNNYLLAIQKFPSNSNLKIGLLNLTVKIRNWPQFLYYANLWHSQLSQNSEFIDTIKTYLDETGRKRDALPLWVQQFRQKQKDPIWLYEFSDALSLLGYTERANLIQKNDWDWIQHIHWTNNVEFIQLYGQLAISQARGDMLWQAAVYNLDRKTPLSKDIAISAALAQENYPTMAWLKNYWYPSPQSAPDWALLTEALYLDDRPEMQRLLKNPHSLQIRDRVTALRKLGNNNQAKALAYEGLVQAPSDAKLYHILSDLMFETSNYHQFDVLYNNVGSFGGANLRWENRTALANNWYVIPRINYWNLSQRDAQQMLNIPKRLGQFQLKLRHDTRHGFNSLRLSLNSAWKNYPGAQWTTEYILRHDLTALIKIDAHEPNTDTNELIVAGMQNYFNVALNYILSPTNTLETEAGAGEILDQTNQFLSQKYSADASLIHRLIGIDSNLTIAPFISSFWYHPSGNLPLDLFQFVPPTQDPSIGYFIPQSFYQYGLRLAWNDEWRFSYRARWEPYFSSEVLNNSVSGFGYSVEGGISGGVFGRDHLKVYALRSSNSGAQNQITNIVGAKYIFYFQ